LPVIVVVDLLAAVSLFSATTLVGALGLTVRTAIGLLDSLAMAGVAVPAARSGHLACGV
jgi:hypothetical protein